MPTKSLAPFGDTLPNALRRLKDAPDESDAELIIMKRWESENVPQAFLSGGFTSLEAIVQGTPPESGKREPVSERDRQVVAATIQWMATNIGRCFYDEFRKAWIEAQKKRGPRPVHHRTS